MTAPRSSLTLDGFREYVEVEYHKAQADMSAAVEGMKKVGPDFLKHADEFKAASQRANKCCAVLDAMGSFERGEW